MATPYIINFSDPGVPSFVLSPGETNDDMSLLLFGQGSTNYGEGINENILHLLENFASPIPPVNPITGQFWYDKTEDIFKFFNGTNFVSAGSVFVGVAAPTAPNLIGQLWWDTSIPQLKVFDGASFTSVADRYVLKSGDIMLGFLTLNADPLNDLEAATKKYVDDNSLPVISGTTSVIDFVKIDTPVGHSGGSGPGADFSFEIDSLSNIDGGGLLIQTGDLNNDQFAILTKDNTGATTFSVSTNSGDAVVAGNVSSNPAPTTGDHLTNKTYVDAQLVSTLPGTVSPYAGPPATVSPSSGWLICDGTEYLRTTYPALFAVIAGIYGGDGSTTFKVPDYQGEFLRGTDNGTGRDPDAGSRMNRGDGTTGDAVGTKQLDIFESHVHTGAGWNIFTGANAGYPGLDGSGDSYIIGPSNSTGGSETRPRNVNVTYIIYAG